MLNYVQQSFRYMLHNRTLTVGNVIQRSHRHARLREL